jgi:hypothetical protein
VEPAAFERPPAQPPAQALVDLGGGCPADVATARALAAVEAVMRHRVQDPGLAAAEALDPKRRHLVGEIGSGWSRRPSNE